MIVVFSTILMSTACDVLWAYTMYQYKVAPIIPFRAFTTDGFSHINATLERKVSSVIANFQELCFEDWV